MAVDEELKNNITEWVPMLHLNLEEQIYCFPMRILSKKNHKNGPEKDIDLISISNCTLEELISVVYTNDVVKLLKQIQEIKFNQKVIPIANINLSNQKNMAEYIDQIIKM